MGLVHWAEVYDPTIVEGDHHLEQEVCIAAGHVLVEMYVTDWTEAQREDPMLSTVLDWLKAQMKIRFEGTLWQYTPSEKRTN